MRRLNPVTGEPFKYGDVREDGYVFKSYNLRHIKRNGEFKEYWTSPASFEKTKEACRRWYEKNSARKIETDKLWRTANQDRKKEANKRRYRKNLDRHKELAKRWREANPDKVNAFNAKRRSAKLQRTPKWLTKDQLLEIQSFYSKAKDLQTLTGIEYHVDHIVPLQGKLVSGLHVPWNLQVITATENLSKHNNYEPTTEDSAANVTV